MSGNHQNTTWRAFDDKRLDSLRQARGNVEKLTSILSALPKDPEANAEHCESVWKSDNIPDIIRSHILRSFLRADPPRWAPLLAEEISSFGEVDNFADETFREVIAHTELMANHAYGVLIYSSQDYASRFGIETALHNKVLCEAFGGEPEKEERDFRYALRNTIHSIEKVRWIAEHIVRVWITL